MLRFEKIFGDAGGNYIPSPAVLVFFDEVARFQSEIPGIVQPTEAYRFISHRGDGESWYKLAGIRAYVATAVSTVEVELDQEESSPIFESREFTFIADTG